MDNIQGSLGKFYRDGSFPQLQLSDDGGSDILNIGQSGGTGYFNPELPKRSDRVNYFKGLKEARNLPHGDPGKDAWAMENHGVTWEAYEAKQAADLEKRRNPHNFLKQKSILALF